MTSTPWPALFLAAALASALTGCRDTCSPHTTVCDEHDCGVVWDCGGDTRELHLNAEGCECVRDGEVSQGSCAENLCSLVSQANDGAIREGDDAFESLDDAVNQACDWNITSVEPIVIGGCVQ